MVRYHHPPRRPLRLDAVLYLPASSTSRFINLGERHARCISDFTAYGLTFISELHRQVLQFSSTSQNSHINQHRDHHSIIIPSESAYTSRYQGVAQVFQGGEKSVYLSQRDAANNEAIVALDDHATIRAQREHMQSETAHLTRKICLAKARKSLRRQIKLIETECISA